MPVEWRKPPNIDNRPPGQPEPEWAKELAANPREWAMVEIWERRPKANYRQQQIAYRRYRWQESYTGEWEATFRATERGYELFVRYIP